MKLTRKHKQNAITAVIGTVIGGVIATAIGKTVMEAGIAILTGAAVGGALYATYRIAMMPVRRLKHGS